MKQSPLLKGHAGAMICWLLILLVYSSAFGQAGRSTVRGTVTDPQGGAVAGAAVTLTNTERSFTRTQVTTDDGGYVFSAVPPGTYKLEVESKGFKKAAVPEVKALVDTTVEQNVQLEIGSVTEVVTVTDVLE